MILVMAFYAVVGEKVPWLIIPQFLPMCFVAVYKLNWQKMVFALGGCLFIPDSYNMACCVHSG